VKISIQDKGEEIREFGKWLVDKIEPHITDACANRNRRIKPEKSNNESGYEWDSVPILCQEVADAVEERLYEVFRIHEVEETYGRDEFFSFKQLIVSLSSVEELSFPTQKGKTLGDKIIKLNGLLDETLQLFEYSADKNYISSDFARFIQLSVDANTTQAKKPLEPAGENLCLHTLVDDCVQNVSINQKRPNSYSIKKKSESRLQKRIGYY
jgi:hypothetical protein